MRHFKGDAVDANALARILSAAHHAGSVGFMQPWNFIIIEDISIRGAVRAHVEKERIRAASAFEGARKETYLGLKLEGILDAAVNICVTCDRERSGPAVLGRNTIRDTDLYSVCAAVQNLWLAARAEGLGVGWVSILEPDALRAILGIPENILPVAYLCVGHVESFPERPTLETSGWAPRIPLEELVFSDVWGRPSNGEMTNALRHSWKEPRHE